MMTGYVSPNAATWKNTAAFLVTLDPDKRLEAIRKIGVAMGRAGHDVDFVADEMQALVDTLADLLARAVPSKGVH